MNSDFTFTIENIGEHPVKVYDTGGNLWIPDGVVLINDELVNVQESARPKLEWLHDGVYPLPPVTNCRCAYVKLHETTNPPTPVNPAHKNLLTVASDNPDRFPSHMYSNDD